MSVLYTFKEIYRAFSCPKQKEALKAAFKHLTSRFVKPDDTVGDSKIEDALEHNTRIQMGSFKSICDLALESDYVPHNYYAEEYLRLLSHNRFKHVAGILNETTVVHVLHLLWAGEDFDVLLEVSERVLAEAKLKDSKLNKCRGYTSLVEEMEQFLLARLQK